MTRELDYMSDRAPQGRMPGRTAAPETPDGRWRQPSIKRWSDFRDFLHGLRVAWVSTASALIGFLLYLMAPQAQDLFLEVKGHWLSDVLFWIAFYLVVMLAWALPVFVSARWILARFEEGPNAHPNVPPVKTWVRRRTPLLLGAVCFAAVFFGQLMAMSNAPTIRDPSLDNTMIRVVAEREYVAHLAYIIAACVLFWSWWVRRSGSSSRLTTARAARWVILTLASFTFLAIIVFLTLFAIGVYASSVQVSDTVLFLAASSLSLLIVGILAWRGKERSLWWLATISAIPIALLILFGFIGYLFEESKAAFGLAHLVVLPALTMLTAVVLWWALAPLPDGRASRLGQLFYHIRGGRGEIGEDEATLRFIKPLFRSLLWLTLAVIIGLVLVHPLNVTGPLRLHRAVLLPVILGMPVALFTYITHWSARVRAPLISVLVVVMGVLLGYNYDIRTVQNAPPRVTLKDAVDQWTSVNGCKEDRASCPSPIIIAAAGGASRSAFHVAGVIGNLLDEQRFAPLRGHRNYVMAASFDPEGARILTASLDGTARIWSAATGQLLRVLGSPTTEIDRAKIERTKIDKAKFIYSAKFSPDGKLVVTASADKAATIWDAETVVRKLEPHEGDVTSAEFSAKGDLVVTTSIDKLVRIWRVTTGELVHKLQHRSAVNSAVFHPDGTKVASGSNDGTIIMWDVTGKEAIKMWDVTGKEAPSEQSMRHDGHDGPVRSVAFSPTGKWLITASDDQTARVWNAATGERLHVLEGHAGRVNSAAFSYDGTKIVTASWDDTVRIWDWDATTAKRPPKVLRAHLEDINSAAFSPDGERIVTASDDGTARVWSRPRTAERDGGTYERHPWQGTSAHPFGKQLFAISAVSGGSLGAVLTYAALADAQRDNVEMGIGRPPCTKKGLRDEAWFGASAIWQQQVQWADPTLSWRDCLQLLSAGDFLSPVFLGMMSNDPLRIPLRENRAVVLEHAWEVRYAQLTGQADGLGFMFKEDADTTLARSLSKVRHVAAGRGIWLPILLLNGTSVQTGRRIVTSDVDTLMRDAEGQVTGRVFFDSYDLHELFGRPVGEGNS